MIRALPDTQLLMWLATNPERLPRGAAKILAKRENEIYFSLVSIWEVAIKYALRRVDFTFSPEQVRDGLLKIGMIELPIQAEHVMAVSRLPLIHRDPFDRLLVAQASVEGLSLLTTDTKMAEYGSFVQRF